MTDSVEVLNTDHGKIVSLAAVKESREQEKSLASYQHYLSLLDGHELLAESRHLIEQIHSKPLILSLVKKCESLVNELTARSQKEVPLADRQYHEIKESLAKCLSSFG